MSRTENPQEDAEQPARPARREPKPLDAKNALLALNRREPETARRAPEADALESLDTERILELPRRKDERSNEPTPITPLPGPIAGRAAVTWDDDARRGDGELHGTSATTIRHLNPQQ